VTIAHAGVSGGILNNGIIIMQYSQIVDGVVNGILNNGNMTVDNSSIFRNNSNLYSFENIQPEGNNR